MYVTKHIEKPAYEQLPMVYTYCHTTPLTHYICCNNLSLADPSNRKHNILGRMFTVIIKWQSYWWRQQHQSVLNC